MLAPAYIYRAVIRSIYDADTIRCDIDCGFGIWKHNEPLRLYGIDAPEVRGPERDEGLRSRDWLRDRLPAGTEVVIETIKDTKGKFGRYLARVHLDGVNLNDELVALGLAERRDY